MALLSICVFSIHSPASFASFHPQNSICLSRHLSSSSPSPSSSVLHSPPLASIPPSPPPVCSSCCRSSIFAHHHTCLSFFSHASDVTGGAACVCVCASASACASASMCTSLAVIFAVPKIWRVSEMTPPRLIFADLSALADPPHPTSPTHHHHHSIPHSAAHFCSHKGVNLSEMSGVLTNSQLLAICLCMCVCARAPWLQRGVNERVRSVLSRQLHVYT